jgi:hypothetical protein
MPFGSLPPDASVLRPDIAGVGEPLKPFTRWDVVGGLTIGTSLGMHADRRYRLRVARRDLGIYRASSNASIDRVQRLVRPRPAWDHSVALLLNYQRALEIALTARICALLVGLGWLPYPARIISDLDNLRLRTPRLLASLCAGREVDERSV